MPDDSSLVVSVLRGAFLLAGQVLRYCWDDLLDWIGLRVRRLFRRDAEESVLDPLVGLLIVVLLVLTFVGSFALFARISAG